MQDVAHSNDDPDIFINKYFSLYVKKKNFKNNSNLLFKTILGNLLLKTIPGNLLLKTVLMYIFEKCSNQLPKSVQMFKKVIIYHKNMLL